MKNILNIPNFLTLLRLLMAPILIYSIIQQNKTLSLLLLFLALLTELDGTIARKWNQETLFGNNFDDIADEIFLIGCLAAMWYAGVLKLPYLIIFLGLEALASTARIIYSIKKKKLVLHAEGWKRAGGISLGIMIFLGILGIPYFVYVVWITIAICVLAVFGKMREAIAL